MQVMAGAPNGGAEAFFVRLAGAFQRRAGDLDLAQQVVIRRHPARAAALRAAGASVAELGFGGGIDIWTARRLRRLAADFRPDIVLAWMSRAADHCRRAMLEQAPKPLLMARLGGYYDLKHYKGFDHLVGNTREIVDWIVGQGWPAERAHYLPNFVTATPDPPLPRATFDTSEGVPLLLALGRLHENKAFDVALRALAQVPDAHLWLVGEGPLRADLERLAQSLGVADRVRMPGWRDDMPALMAAADIAICPSRLEPLGNVVLEAWAHGRPIVAAASAGPAALIDDGRTGLLVPVEDADALAAAIQRLIAEPDCGRVLVDAGRAHYDANFTEEAVVGQYMDLFRAVTADRATSAVRERG